MSIPSDVFERIDGIGHARKFLQHNIRTDGRALDAARKTTVKSGSISSADGSSVVRIGHTQVVCGLKLEVGKPIDLAPRAGRIVVTVNLSPLCSHNFSIGRATDHSVRVGEWLTNHIMTTKLFSADELCIADKQSVWVIYADIVCLDYDGNILDASLLALVHALKQLTLPATTINEETNEVYITDEKSNRHLNIRHTPVAVTFGMIDEYLLVDPTSKEEQLTTSSITVVYNDGGQLCGVYKPGGAAISTAHLPLCMQLAKRRALQLTREIAAESSAASTTTTATSSPATSSTAAATTEATSSTSRPRRRSSVSLSSLPTA